MLSKCSELGLEDWKKDNPVLKTKCIKTKASITHFVLFHSEITSHYILHLMLFSIQSLLKSLSSMRTMESCYYGFLRETPSKDQVCRMFLRELICIVWSTLEGSCKNHFSNIWKKQDKTHSQITKIIIITSWKIQARKYGQSPRNAYPFTEHTFMMPSVLFGLLLACWGHSSARLRTEWVGIMIYIYK